MVGTRVRGGTAAFQRAIRDTLGTFPPWFVAAARISEFVVTDRPEVREQMAQYEHGTRKLLLSTAAIPMLRKSLGHELAHGLDDNFGSPHFFTASDTWRRIHRAQAYFDIPKYREEPLEYFADMVTKLFLLGQEKLQLTHPIEVRFITAVVFPSLQKAFG